MSLRPLIITLGVLFFAGMGLSFDLDSTSDPVIMRNHTLSDIPSGLMECTSDCVHGSKGVAQGMDGCISKCLDKLPKEDHQLTISPAGQFFFTPEALCRTDSNVMLKFLVDLFKKSAAPAFGPAGLYILEIKSNLDSWIYVSSQSTILVMELQPNTEYVASGFVLSISHRIELITDTPFSTRANDFRPASVTNISVVAYEHHDENLSVTIQWEIPRQRGCFYTVLWHATDEDAMPREKIVSLSGEEEANAFERLTLNDFRFGTTYRLAIRGRSSLDYDARDGPLLWTEILTPSCLEWSGNDLELCPPAKPEKLAIERVESLPHAHHFDVRVSWKMPKALPKNYTIELSDLDIPGDEDGHQSYRFNITSANATEFTFRSIPLYGSHFEVSLVAHSMGGTSGEAFVTNFYDKPTVMSANQEILDNLQMVILILISLVVIAGVSFMGYRVYLQRRKPSEMEGLDSVLYSQHPRSYYEDEPRSLVTGLRLPTDDPMELLRSNIELLGDLGEGHFGLVKLGRLKSDSFPMDDQFVAIKMLKETATLKQMVEFRREMDMMKSVGAHQNIVSIVGHVTQDFSELMLLTEYCSRGNLLHYLQSAWKHMHGAVYEEIQINEAFDAVENKGYQLAIHEPSQIDLLQIALQVAVGMDFLSQNKVIHRDLAARNVLLDKDLTVKIADFGLSRDIYQSNMYRKSGSGQLPFKWMALESLCRRIYTSQSDVWSYGILLYELVTFGATPYPSVEVERLAELLNAGYRMEKPDNCDDLVYELMYSCWNAQANERPQFSSIVCQVSKMLDHFST